VDQTTGLRACRHIPGKTQMTVYEFWPSDLRAIFRAAGLSLREPPQYQSGCSLARQAAAGQAPEITSPQPELIYAMRSEPRSDETIPFSAVGDGDARRFYWFVDSHFAGVSDADRPLMWRPRSGTFQIQVVDDHNRAAMTELKVEMVR
jgi:penicillin-binding protein 1C